MTYPNGPKLEIAPKTFDFTLLFQKTQLLAAFRDRVGGFGSGSFGFGPLDLGTLGWGIKSLTGVMVRDGLAGGLQGGERLLVFFASQEIESIPLLLRCSVLIARRRLRSHRGAMLTLVVCCGVPRPDLSLWLAYPSSRRACIVSGIGL